MTILDKLVRAGARRATRCALAIGERRFTFSDLEGGSNAAARVLRGHGVTHGDRVAIFADKGLEWILAYLGALKLGAIALPINPAYRERELAHILPDAAPTAVVIDPSTRDLALSFAPQSVRTFLECGALERGAEGASPAVDRRVHPFYQAVRKASVHPVDELIWDKDDALLLYTSGTTGAPKGAVLTHANLDANAQAMVAAFGWSSEDRLVHALPLFHVHGLCVGLHGAIVAGSETILLPRFDADLVLRTLKDREATLFMGVPTMYARFLEVATRAAGITQADALPSMRLFVSGSAPLPQATYAAFRERFGHEILERYGMTETLITLCQPRDQQREPGTVGVPVLGMEARIDPSAPADTRGELQVRGTSVGPRYWNNPSATEESRIEGWFRTGDIAERTSPDGAFRIVGRAKELIITGGYNVYPREVEDVLLEHPAVSEACVYGRPDPDLGESIHAAIVLGPGMTDDTAERITERTAELTAELLQRCRDRLASFKKPRDISIVAELPRNAMGKVVREQLIPVRSEAR